MRNVKKIGLFAGVVLLFNGCVGGSPVMENAPYDSNKLHIAQYDEEQYYYRPDYSWSQVLDANTAHLNSVASSDVLTCKENDIWYISVNEREAEAKVRYRYMLSLAKSQLMKMRKEADYIPRRDSKEFKDLIALDTQLAKQGLIGCSSKLSSEQMKKIKY